MTVFVGVYCQEPGSGVPQALKASLAGNLRASSNESGRTLTYDRNTLFLAKWDSGAFAEPAWRESKDGSVCALAGDPLLPVNGSRIIREQQLARLCSENGMLNDAELARCRGSFALVNYVAASHTLQLATDVVGLRPIYYVAQNGYLIFSTALRVLEAVPQVRKSLSLLGMAELSVFSFPLAERTPYEGLTILRECQVLTARALGVSLRNYYDWAIPGPTLTNPKDAAEHLHATFQDAVRIRAGSDKRVYSFLSGGMDSRAIVATLVAAGRDVVAMNFSANESQDQRYAQMFAAAAGARVKLHCSRGGSFPNFSFLALAAKVELERRELTRVDRPQCVWSGDGGSVSLGHVYMDSEMVDYADRGDVKAAAKHFFDFNRIALSTGALTRRARTSLPPMLFESVLAEVNRYPRADIGRCIYLFLLFNDQRRHLFKHFETIDQHGLELLTPFYDAEFLKAVAATPARWGILHRLYSMFFELLPSFALKTPWQTYPGHVPCPLPQSQNATYQWSRPTDPPREGIRQRGRLAQQMLAAFDRSLQPQVFSRNRIWLAAALHTLGIRDCRHILPQLQVFQSHHMKTQPASSSLTE